ncbi:calcium-binding protein [Reyranella sp.]|uniref:calcium-binding protein n=1 Tax=Reyranella sp. TaxID=1929291 RepID=UPI003D13C9C8
MSSVTYGISVDRDAGAFDVQIDYYIEGYYDPETGEYFGDTSWTAGVGGYVNAGYAGESDSPVINLGLGSGAGEELAPLTFSFYAQNSFTGVSVAFSLNLLVAGYSTLDLAAIGTAGVDVAITGSGDDILRGYGGNDYLDAGAGDDIVDGGDGDDRLDGGAGDDTMAGGTGNDVYIVDSAADAVVEGSNRGDDSVIASVSYTLSANVERLMLAGSGPIDGTGNAGANRIDGNGAVNTLRGLDGDDQLSGAEGNDILEGGAGNDRLDGGTGRDRMTGGDGDDSYVVDSTYDQVIEAANGGIDTVSSLLSSYVLGANVEKLVVLSANGQGTGNDLDNTLFGSAGNNRLDGGLGSDELNGMDGDDTLIGGLGADTLNGGAGSDWASYAGATAALRVDLAGLGSRGDATGDSYTGIENVLGGSGGDLLKGDALGNVLEGALGDDALYGLDGDDTLIGGAGADRLSGGAGRDTVSYRGSTGAVTVDLGTQTVSGGDAAGDTIVSFASAAGGLGNDTLLGSSGANRLFGDAGADHLDGGAGNDVVEGGSGADVLIGGLGIDRLSYAHAGAGVRIDLAAGTATGSNATGDSFSGFEGVDGSGFADRLTGDGNANRLSGGAGNDILNGGGGDDTIIGGLGADTMAGGTGIDTLSYAGATSYLTASLRDGFTYGADAQGDSFSGFENLTGGSAGDALYGDDQVNVIRGGGGGDFIDGGGGNDRLYGEAGDDTFYVNATSGKDRIYGFQAGGTEDRLLLDLGASVESFAAAMATATMVNGSTVFHFAAGTELTLVGVDKSTLTAADIVFQIEE